MIMVVRRGEDGEAADEEKMKVADRREKRRDVGDGENKWDRDREGDTGRDKSSSRDSDGGVAVDWGKDGQSCCDEGDDDREGIGEEMMMWCWL